MNRSQLFKVLAVPLTGLLMIGMAGCGTEETAVAVAPAPAPAPAPTPAPDPVPVTVEVALGELGGSITLTQTDTGYTLNGEAFASGSTVTADPGSYVVTLADGTWTADFQETTSTVDLGTSGSMVTVEVAEDGSFSIGSAAIASGATVTAENGNVYVLTMADGAWSAMFQAGAAMQIANTPVSAVVNEDGVYDVVGGEGTIGEDGMGMVSSGGLNYRVMKDGDDLVGTLYDMVGEDASMALNPADDAELALSADDADTDLDESGTMLDLAALKAGGDAAETAVSLGSLFDGSNAAIEETFIAGVVETLNAELVLLKANIDIAEEEANADSTRGMNLAWEGANTALEILGLGGEALGATPDWDDAQDYQKERANAVTALEEAIAALDSQAAFTAALGDEGVLSAVEDDYDATQYGTVKSSADISFNSTANTRFGVVSTTERDTVGADIASSFSKFVWSPLDAVTSAPLLEEMSATYSGQTTAVTDPQDSTESPEFISGDIELTVRLDTARSSTRRSQQVGTIAAVVSNLQDSEGNTFDNGEGDVESITLPDADIMDSGDTVDFEAARAASTVKYVDRLEEEDLEGNYVGRFVGDGATDEDAALAAIGLWQLWTENGSNAAYRDLVGSWGAELTAVTPDEVVVPTPTEPEGGDAFSDAALARMRVTFGETAIGDEIEGIDLVDLIAASGDVQSLKDGDNAVTKILEELTTQLDDLEDLIDATNYGAEDMGSITAPGADLTDGEARRTAILTAVIGATGAVGRGGVTIAIENLVTGAVAGLNINDAAYVEDTLRDWDEELLESLDKVVEAFSSKANLDAALDEGIFGAAAILSSYKAVGTNDPVLTTGAVFDVVPSAVNAVFDYTEYTRFGLWTSETIAAAATATGDPSVAYEASAAASTTATGLYAYSPLGNTGLLRADLPSDVKGSYEGYTYATAADQTIYGGDLTITIDWSVNASDVDTTGIEVMISDLTDSDGMGWTDTDGDPLTEDPIVTSITFDSQAGSKLVGFDATNTNTLGTTRPGADVDVAGFNKIYAVPAATPLVIARDKIFELVYDDDSVIYAEGAITGQFLGVSAADSGNADQPRAIIGEWNIAAERYVVAKTEIIGDVTTTTFAQRLDGATPAAPIDGSTLDGGVYGADLMVP